MTPIYGLTEWAAAQAAPWVAHNAALRVLEAADRASVLDRDLTAPPGTCVDGAAYLVAATATGAWAGHDGELAVAVGTDAANGWLFATVASEGKILWVADETLRIQFISGAWSVFPVGGTAAALDYDTDPALGGGGASDAKIATQLAVKTYVDGALAGLLDLKGGTDCSANPDYPAALKGDAWLVTVAGMIGGASGQSVDVGDVFIASADNAGGTQAAVGASWFILEHNITSAGGGLAAAIDTDIWTGTSTAVAITPDALFDASKFQTLTDGPTITPNFGAGLNFKVTLGGNRTLANPTSAKDGQSGVIRVIQDGTGSRTLSYGANWRFPGGAASGGVLSTAASSIDIIAYVVGEGGLIYATLNKAFAA